MLSYQLLQMYLEMMPSKPYLGAANTPFQEAPMSMSRRKALGLVVAGGTAAATKALMGGNLNPLEEKPTSPGPNPHSFAPKLLPFVPTKLKGISEKLIVSHHDNNYAGAVTGTRSIGVSNEVRRPWQP